MKVLDSRLAAQLNLKYPIIQAPIGSKAGIELAAAISNAGSLGSLALTWTELDIAMDLAQGMREQTSNTS